MAGLETQLIAAGLPCVDVNLQMGQTPHFSRPLTLAEEDIRDSIVNPSARRSRISDEWLKSHLYARTTEAEWASYYDTNLDDAEVDALVATITNIPTAQAALRVMWKRQNALFDKIVQVEIAIRNLVCRNDAF